jgi:protein TonB
MNKNTKLGPFVATSAVLHGGLFALIVFGPYLFPGRAEATWGTTTDKSVRVGMTHSLPGVPLPSPAVVRDDAYATNTKTLNPAEPAPKPVPKVPEVADVKIPAKDAKIPKKTDVPKPPQPARVEAPPAPSEPTNAIPGEARGQVALPYGQAAGTGPATFGGDGSFGTRFGHYVRAMTTAIESQWRHTPPAGRGKSRVYVTFTIERNGAVRDLSLSQRSGVATLDNSAVLAVRSAKLPPLPREYSGSSVEVRFYFEYAR